MSPASLFGRWRCARLRCWRWPSAATPLPHRHHRSARTWSSTPTVRHARHAPITASPAPRARCGRRSQQRIPECHVRRPPPRCRQRSRGRRVRGERGRLLLSLRVHRRVPVLHVQRVPVLHVQRGGNVPRWQAQGLLPRQDQQGGLHTEPRRGQRQERQLHPAPAATSRAAGRQECPRNDC